jgi:hypothetical protein
LAGANNGPTLSAENLPEGQQNTHKQGIIYAISSVIHLDLRFGDGPTELKRKNQKTKIHPSDCWGEICPSRYIDPTSKSTQKNWRIRNYVKQESYKYTLLNCCL